MNKFYCFCLILFLFPDFGFSQNPVPADQQTKRILLIGGVVHAGNGTVINNGAVGFENGKLILVGDASVIRIDRAAYDTVIDISGKHVYPGLIALNTTIGLNEIEAVRATNDINETGSINPSVRSVIAYNTDSKVTPTIRSNGVLLAQVVPGGGLVSGQSSVMELDGWNYEDAVFLMDDGVHVRWPSMRKSKNVKDDVEEKQQQRIESELQQIRKLFTDARAYSQLIAPVERNIHLESLRGLFDGSKSLYIHCNFVKEIIAAAGLCAELGMNMVLIGGTDALLVTGLLKSQRIPVVIVKTHRLPSRDDEPVDMPYTFAAQLRDAGIKFAISADEFWQVRNLAFHAGTAVAHGLSKEAALTAITLTPAEILGIQKRVGSLETGKDATLVIASGDLLDMKSATVEAAFIRGKQLDLDNIQTQLNRKFRKKYGLK
ncbi:MAG: amidohydrolase family protein [Bacteroidota bacterium]|nr:amidohydrolase family protein [Bacteroidota bacterium]